MNEQLWLLDLLIEKHRKAVPIPIQHQHIFPYFRNKIQFIVRPIPKSKVKF